MEKISFSNFPEKIEVTKEGNVFTLYCALCGLNLLETTAKPPYVAIENKLRQAGQLHNRQEHWPDLTSLYTT